MCMGTELSKRSLRRYKQGKEYIRVWKVVNTNYGKYNPERGNLHKPFKKGLNHAWTGAKNSDEFIHAFRDKQSAKEWCWPNQRIIECLIKPKWVIAIGRDEFGTILRTLTTKAIVMPGYPDTKVTVREFKKAIK